MYHATEEKRNPNIWQSSLFAAYTFFTKVQRERETPDLEKALKYLDLAESLGMEHETMKTETSLKNLRADIYLSLGQYSKAIEEALSVLDILREDTEKYPDSAKDRNFPFREAYRILSLSSAQLGDYSAAYKYKEQEHYYDRKELDSERHTAVKELETRYEVKIKEQEIENLQEENRFQNRLRLVLIFVAVLLGIILIITLYLFRIKAKKSRLQIQLKEEEAQLAELEKYQALSEIHLKELEIYGKNSDLEKLREQKNALDEEVRNYSRKIQEYEKEKEEEKTNHNRNISDPIVEELSDLINRRVSNEGVRNSYLERLSSVNDSFINKLKANSDGSLSLINIKYCIFISINIDSRDFANCFSVELPTARTIRYRLKKKFNLAEEEDLTIYLNNLLRSVR